MALGIRAGVVAVAHDGRGHRTAQRTVAAADDAMQFVIAVADGLGGCSGHNLVGRGRGLLQQLAVALESFFLDRPLLLSRGTRPQSSGLYTKTAQFRLSPISVSYLTRRCLQCLPPS